MSQDLRAIIDEIASQADDFLAGADNRAQARAGISELITLDYPGLTPVQRDQVTQAVMGILEDEDFFSATPGGGDEDGSGDGESEE